MLRLTSFGRPGLEQIFELAEDRPACAAATDSLLDAVRLPERFNRRLRRRFADPALPYHDAAHVGLLWLRYLAHGGAADDLGIALAILFHDAVYRPRERYNEAESAALLRAAVGPVEEVEWATVTILATADHLAYTGNDLRTLRVLDLDLSPLAEHPATFARNSDALRQEQCCMSEADWQTEQVSFLRDVRCRPPIFRSGLGVFYEEAAARNLASVLDRPGSGRLPDGV